MNFSAFSRIAFRTIVLLALLLGYGVCIAYAQTPTGSVTGVVRLAGESPGTKPL